jgi:hypothetical protein
MQFLLIGQNLQTQTKTDLEKIAQKSKVNKMRE